MRKILVIGAFLIASALAIGGRYTAVSSGQGAFLFVVDRFTGQVTVCWPTPEGINGGECGPADDWVPVTGIQAE